MLPYRDEATFPIQRFGFDYRDRNGGSPAVRRLRAAVLSDFVLKRADPGQRQFPGCQFGQPFRHIRTHTFRTLTGDGVRSC
jgi:hypothetical protein